ncbi:hypothetical protein FB45DRAFT_858693 [Roridomyces roridus]|uniref:Uncharacterized protein n=1 Tax=Roridomyces roridus TaxID=1738132 RepID=A0AAD7CHY8_9AGAR|nr:hypothetical protein FB45DRAFT_858693 [Roridomyces roridus]
MANQKFADDFVLPRIPPEIYEHPRCLASPIRAAAANEFDRIFTSDITQAVEYEQSRPWASSSRLATIIAPKLTPPTYEPSSSAPTTAPHFPPPVDTHAPVSKKSRFQCLLKFLCCVHESVEPVAGADGQESFVDARPSTHLQGSVMMLHGRPTDKPPKYLAIPFLVPYDGVVYGALIPEYSSPPASLHSELYPDTMSDVTGAEPPRLHPDHWYRVIPRPEHYDHMEDTAAALAAENILACPNPETPRDADGFVVLYVSISTDSRHTLVYEGTHRLPGPVRVGTLLHLMGALENTLWEVRRWGAAFIEGCAYLQLWELEFDDHTRYSGKHVELRINAEDVEDLESSISFRDPSPIPIIDELPAVTMDQQHVQDSLFLVRSLHYLSTFTRFVYDSSHTLVEPNTTPSF